MSAVGLWALSPVGRWHYVVAGDLGPVAACGRWSVEATTETATRRPDGACELCRGLAVAAQRDERPGYDATRAERNRRLVESMRLKLADGATIAEAARLLDVAEHTARRAWQRRHKWVPVAEVSP